MIDFNLKKMMETSKNKDILIEKGKQTIHARFEDCDIIGVSVVLEGDKAKVVDSYAKREIKTFIPWHCIENIRIP